jgi:hypothetical protein
MIFFLLWRDLLPPLARGTAQLLSKLGMRRQAQGIAFCYCLSPSAYRLYKYGISLWIFFDSTGATVVDCLNRRLRFLFLLDSK